MVGLVSRVNTLFDVGKRWIAAGGWDVELIRLNGRPTFRVRRHGVLERYCTSMGELKRVLESRGVDPADLTEARPRPEDPADPGQP